MIDRHRAHLKSESLSRRRTKTSAVENHLFATIVKIIVFLPQNIRSEKYRLLRSAGYCERYAIVIFWAMKVVSAVLSISCLAAYLTILFTDLGEYNAFGTFSLLFAGMFWLPDFFVRFRRASRLKKIERGLPDGLDLLVICAEAGLSLDAGLKRVADEFVTVVPELSEELLLTSVELNFLPDRRQALTNLAQRADVAAFRGVTATLIQTEKYGTPLAQSLRTLASEFRESRLLQAEEKAARLPAILTIPMIVFILPALFIVLAAPAFIQVAEKIGN